MHLHELLAFRVREPVQPLRNGRAMNHKVNTPVICDGQPLRRGFLTTLRNGRFARAALTDEGVRFLNFLKSWGPPARDDSQMKGPRRCIHCTDCTHCAQCTQCTQCSLNGVDATCNECNAPRGRDLT